MRVASLAPKLGYDNAAKLAKEAFTTNQTIRQLVLEKGLIEEPELNTLLDAGSMTRPEK